MRSVDILKAVLKDFYFNDDYRNKNSTCDFLSKKKLVSLNIIFF